MVERVKSHAVGAFVAGAIAGAVVALALRGDGKPPPAASETSPAPPPRGEDESLMAANSRLVSALHDCDQRLRQQIEAQKTAPTEASAPPPASAPTPAPATSERPDRRGFYSREDWERFAQQGVVPFRIPCANEAAAAADVSSLEAPSAVREVYASSNRRVLAHMAPLCSAAVGPAAAEKMGPSGCLRAIIDYARRDNAERLRQTLVRVDEINSGKIAPPSPTDGVDPITALLLGITAEAKALHMDLTARLGAEEADRVFNSRGVCSERGFVSASSDAQ